MDAIRLLQRSLLKRLPRFTRAGRKNVYLDRLPELLAMDWEGFEPRPTGELGGELFEVPCRNCPKYTRFPPRCTVPFGSRLRSCICASTEYHLRDLAGKRVLELGCGESAFARSVVESGGGRWIGLDQRAGKGSQTSVRSVAARVPYLPFRDASVDVLFGNQTIEHWQDPFTPGATPYSQTMAEVWRVLKPGGWAYFDAPIHLHGAAEFVRGDIETIRALFSFQDWRDVRLLAWRRKHRPLRAHRAPPRESERWCRVLVDATDAELVELKHRVAWILAIRATKPA